MTELGANRADDPTPPVPWRVVLLAASGAEVLPGEALQFNAVPMDPNPVDVHVWTRQDDVGLGVPLPRELVFEVLLDAEDATVAISAAGSVAGGMVTFFSFAVNAFVSPPEPLLAYESAPGLDRRRYWQREVTLQTGVPRPSRRLDPTLLNPMLQAFFTSSEMPRLSRAVSQYQIALSHWTVSGRPLALAHLYMALEALGPVAERAERERLG